MSVHGVLLEVELPRIICYKLGETLRQTHTAVWSVVEMHNAMCSFCFSTFET